MRDCENCKHYVEKVEVGKGSSPEHYWGCDSWECEFEAADKIFTKADIDAIVKAINKGWELRVNEVLDKIRAEIETKYGRCKLTEYIVQYDGICTSANDMGDIADILQIIDKYKAETEGKNA